MTKFFLTALTACAVMTASAAVPDYDQAAALAGAKADVPNWMSYLPDDVFVAHVSIPGTHDTMTAESWDTATGSEYSTTQAKTLEDQLAAGVRAFDFRPGMKNNQLYCNHGIDRTNRTLASAFDALTDYLDQHPKEFFVIHLFRGNVYATAPEWYESLVTEKMGTEADKAKYNELFDAFFNNGKYSNYIIDYNPRLTVKDMRGKMVIFRRSQIDFAHIAKAGNLYNWPGDKDPNSHNVAVSVQHATNPDIYGTMYATDISSPTNKEELQVELDCLSAIFQKSSQQAKPNDAKRNGSYKPYWVMPFTSGAYGVEKTVGYEDNATYTNPHFTKLLRDAQAAGTTGPCGTVLSDWVLVDRQNNKDVMGVDIVPAIYENNFYYIKDFILDDELFADNGEEEEIENIFDDTKWYLMRNVATGQFLSGGFWWGTHAALDNAGMKVQPHVAEGKYYFFTDRTRDNRTNVLGGIGDPYVDNNEGVPGAAKYQLVRVGDSKYVFKGAKGDGTEVALGAESRKCYGSNYVVSGVPVSINDPMQQWELFDPEEYFQQDLERLPLKDGIDLTYRIGVFAGNGPDNDSWKASDGGSFLSPSKLTHIGVETNGSDGAALMSFRNDSGKSQNTKWTLTKEITNLPNGVYKFSFDAYMGNDSDIKVTVSSGSSSQTQTMKNEGGNGTQSIDDARSAMLDGNHNYSFDITVTNGTIKFVATEGNNHGSATADYFGGFKLVYFGTEEQFKMSKILGVQEAIDEATAFVFTLPEYCRDGWEEDIAPYQYMVDNLTIEGDGSKEIAEIKELMKTYLRKNVDPGANYTLLIENHSFENGDGFGWTIEFKGDTGIKPNSNGTYHVDNADGDYVFNTWDGDGWGSDLSQTIPALAPGIYRVDAMMTADAGNNVRFAVNNEEVTVTAQSKTLFEEASIEIVLLEESDLTITVKGVNCWYKADNFRLTLVAPLSGMDEALLPVTMEEQFVTDPDARFYIAAKHDTGHHTLAPDGRGMLARTDADENITHISMAQAYTLSKEGGVYYLSPVSAPAAIRPMAVADNTLQVALVKDAAGAKSAIISDASGSKFGFHPTEKTFGTSEAHTTPAMLYTSAYDATLTGVDDVTADGSDEEAIYYNLQGVRVDRPAAGTVCIKVQGGKATKVIVK